jgi:hypothetical protein
MKKKCIIFVFFVTATGTVGGLIIGYHFGQRESQLILRSAPLVFYVQDTWHDCLSIRELKKGNVQDVLHDLNMNLNEQIKNLWWIWKAAPSSSDREQAFDLLLDVSQHRGDFELVSPESKDGRWLYPALDEIKKEAGMKKALNQPSGAPR